MVNVQLLLRRALQRMLQLMRPTVRTPLRPLVRLGRPPDRPPVAVGVVAVAVAVTTAVGNFLLQNNVVYDDDNVLHPLFGWKRVPCCRFRRPTLGHRQEGRRR